jgi:hypothetical protein
MQFWSDLGSGQHRHWPQRDVGPDRIRRRQRGEFAAAIELRRRFPGITDNAQAWECVRIIAGWKPLPLRPMADAETAAVTAGARRGRLDRRPASLRHLFTTGYGLGWPNGCGRLKMPGSTETP